MTAAATVLRGHLVITLPVVLMTAAAGVAFSLLIGPPVTDESMTVWSIHSARLPIGALAGCAAGWIWWSFAVPRWRDWAKDSGADEEQTQCLAERTLLVWPKGWFFEKTEFRRRRPMQ